MLKRIFLLVALLLAMPVLAHPWSLTSAVSTSGGQLQVRTSAPQTAVGSVFKTYTTHAVVPVYVTADPGYVISIVRVNNNVQTPPPGIVNMGINAASLYPNSTAQTVSVSFDRQLVAVTVTGGPGGTVSPPGTLNLAYNSAKSYTLVPNAGNKVAAISGLSGLTYTLKDATNTTTVTLPYAGTVTLNLTVPASATTLTATFQTVIANAGAPQTVLTGNTATLDGTGSTGTGLGYTWSQTSGPAVTLTGANTAKPTFPAAVAGTYNFTLVASDGMNSDTAYTSVYVTDSAATAARNQCANCHAGSGLSPAVYTNWSASQHKAKVVICARCHVGADTGGHPASLISGSVSETTFTYASDGTNFCATCHGTSIVNAFAASSHKTHALTCSSCHTNGVHNADFTATACVGCHGSVSGHPFPMGTSACTTCHDPHSTVGGMADLQGAPHYNNVTSGAYPASYVTSRATCMDCHYEDPANATIRRQWDQSGHAATNGLPWTDLDFKTRPGCVQCHTTTGFIAYSTGRTTAAWGDAADKTKEVLTCVGCHADITTGTIRTVAPVRPYADDPYTNRNVGESNICMGCHSGTNNGLSITAKLDSIPPGDFTSQPFIDPHYLAAGGTLHGKAGYQFSDRTYAFYSSNSHRLIGMGNSSGTGTGGPCIACHKNSINGHAFTADFQNGVIPVCANCHGPALTADQLNADKQDYTNALGVLRAGLATKGFFYYSSATPRFPNTNWGADQAGANTMGAAFNYALLRSEPGAYVHNSAYAKQLIFDSIDYLHNGRVTGDISSAITSLVSSGAISEQAADNLAAYKAKTGCTTCHTPGTTGSHPAHMNDGFSCADCHNATATTSTTLVPGTLTHINGVMDVVIAPANNGGGSANFNMGARTCSSVSCHAGGPVTWGSGPLACESCHTGTLSSINGATAPDKSLASTRGHGQTAIGLQCLDCHDRSKRHLGGAGMLQSSLTGAPNTECNYCHNTFAQVPNCPVCSGRSACAACHDPHGTTNLSMIRTSILAQSITFTSGTFGFVNAATNRGLCQVCHTTTTHYRAGVPETGHYTSGCLTCHGQNPNGDASPPDTCDSCHGYPPAPRNPALSFGTSNNWSNARFEEYSGGGGAHLVVQHVSPAAKPSDGWVNCTLCHNGGRTDSTPHHQMITPVKNHVSNVHVEVDPSYRFDNSFTIYTGAKQVNPPDRNVTGSCFNISCHMSPSPRWSTER